MKHPEIEHQATLDALARMRADGADLSQPHEIDFHVAVRSSAAGEAVAAEAEPLGFRTRVVHEEEEDSWTVWCTRTLVPTEPQISAIENQLDAIARPHGGYTDGWGSWSGSWPASDPPASK